MEHLTQKVKFEQRIAELEKFFREPVTTAAMRYLTEQIEMAYAAGARDANLSANNVNPTTALDEPVVGVLQINAGNYAKDKGYFY
jgi:hypothetical protein